MNRFGFETITSIVLSFVLAIAVATGAFAGTEQEQSKAEPIKPAEKPYLRTKPSDGVFDVVVLGDSLADGLYAGLKRLNGENDKLKITKASKVNTGLVRSDRFDWNKRARKIARSKRHQIAVVLLGLNDLQTFRTKGKRHHFQQKGWEKLYQERIDKMVTDLKKANMAVYWVGIPITSPRRYQKEYAYLNKFFRAAAERHAVRYVDTWTPLASPKGTYSPFWRDKNGKRQHIRHNDGVHFTPNGYMVFASFLNSVLQADIEAVLEEQAQAN